MNTMPQRQQALRARRVSARWLVLARAAWMVSAVLALGILLASLPAYLLLARYGDFARRAVAAPAGLVRALDLGGALASFTSAVVCVALAGLLFWRKPSDRMALFVSFYLLVYGIVFAGPLEHLAPLVPRADLLATDVLQPVLFVVPSVALLALLPTGQFVPRWTRWLVLLTSLLALVWLLLARNAPAQWWADPTNPLTLAYYAFAVLALGVALGAQIYRYRQVSSPSERQQSKWVASGVVGWALLAGVGGVAVIGEAGLPPGVAIPWWTPVGQFLWWLSLTIVPLALTVAVLRFRLFDLDLLIRRTLVYGPPSFILGAVYLAVILGAQAAVRAVTGQTGQQAPFIVASTLLVIALFNPVRRQLQAVIDRRFYRRKYDAEKTLAAFSATLRQEVDLGQLQVQLVAVVEETMRPAHISLWVSRSSRSLVQPPDASVSVARAADHHSS